MRHTPCDQPLNSLETALRRVRRERNRGHHRKALLLLRRAAFEAKESPGVWTRYALCCAEEGKSEDAARAFSQAVWLCQRDGSKKRAHLTLQLASDAKAGTLPRIYSRRH